jgi:hypothetical protein
MHRRTTVAEPPTTREAVIEQHAESLWREFGQGVWEHIDRPVKDVLRGRVGRLLDAGVLADPAERAELDALREQAAHAFADQTQLRQLFVNDDGEPELDLVPPHELALAFVHTAKGMLGKAPNYTETPVEFPAVAMEVSAAGDPERFLLTVQRAGKVTPHEARVKAEEDLAATRKEWTRYYIRVCLALGLHHSGDGEGPCVTCGCDAPCTTRLALIGTHEPDVWTSTPGPSTDLEVERDGHTFTDLVVVHAGTPPTLELTPAGLAFLEDPTGATGTPT